MYASQYKPISLIFAQDANGVIGYKNKLPWNHPEDLKYFRQLTFGCTVIMGYNTYLSMPPKGLPCRNCIVVNPRGSELAESYHSAEDLNQALMMGDMEPTPEIFIIGGTKLFEEVLNYSSRLDFAYVTLIPGIHEGDAKMPWYWIDRFHKNPIWQREVQTSDGTLWFYKYLGKNYEKQ